MVPETEGLYGGRPRMPRKGGALYDARRMLPRMSWHPRNLFCLHERSLGQRVNDTSFRSSNKTVYWQRSRSKALLRGYHGDWIREKKFKQHWLPASLPTVRNACQPGSDVPHTPVTSMMWAELEKRLDVAIFRACLVESVYEARRLVIHGRVRLNGAKVRPLAPGCASDSPCFASSALTHGHGSPAETSSASRPGRSACWMIANRNQAARGPARTRWATQAVRPRPLLRPVRGRFGCRLSPRLSSSSRHTLKSRSGSPPSSSSAPLLAVPATQRSRARGTQTAKS